MTRDQIISMAREAGFWREHINAWMCSPEELERFYELATAKEREARQAAQIENEELKARLARADLEQQRAVLAEREACAKVSEESVDGGDMHCCMLVAMSIAIAIRARKESDHG
jgi:hypothetical protein